MKRGNRPELMWGFGLDTETAQRIESAVGNGYYLRNHDLDALPGAKDLEQGEKPCVTWIDAEAWDAMGDERRRMYQAFEDTQRILIRTGEEIETDISEVLADGFLTVVTGRLTSAKVQDALYRAKELSGLYTDLYRMTEEIILERELLSRKTDQLLFLNKVLTGAAESLDPCEILANARTTLNMLLPVRAVHAAIWNPDEPKSHGTDLYISKGLSRSHQTEWGELLLEHVTRMGGPIENSRRNVVTGASSGKGTISPREGRLAVLPLAAGVTFGCLALVCEQGAKLGKDQVQTLHSAVNHLALALRNAMLFVEMKNRADRDGLTRIYNRQSFEERLVEELKRQRRYRHELSLLMIDLDHFKNINDTYGHLAGDMVLEEMGAILQRSLRSTDVAARYGGEEFAVLLPHTTEVDAWRLAERIRERLENKSFRFQDKEFSVTASIGVSSASSSSLAGERELVGHADEALYKAKKGGRNMVVVSGNAVMEAVRQ